MSEGVSPSLDLRMDIPHSARIYDYLLGGKDNFQADRDAAAAITSDWPSLSISMRANRNFMARATRYVAAELGIRQFLDIGTGLPTPPNLHEVAQSVAADARIVYVDNDPIVLAHARALLAGTPQGKTGYIDADLRHPETILGSRQLRDNLDLKAPVALSLVAILQFITDEAVAHSIIATLLEQLAPGSALVLSTVTNESNPEEVDRGQAVYRSRGIPNKSRDLAEVTALFQDLDLVDPGVVLVHRWHSDAVAAALPDSHVQMYGGVAIKR